MKELRRSSLFAAAILSLCWATFAQAALPYIELGPGDPLAIDQPRVAVEVYTDPNDPGSSFGPQIANTFLLDTGAQGIMAVGSAVNEMTALGYETVAVFDELGLGGTSPYDVSEAYYFDFSGSDYQRNSLSDVRLLSNADVSFGSFSGIVGMPAMVNRVTTLDFTAMLGGPFGIDYMGVEFSSTLPADNGHRYSIPLDMLDFPPSGQRDPNDPLPTYAPLPMVNAEFRHEGASTTASLIVDTGAQLSIIGESVAFALGLDKNGNGTLDDEALGFMAFSGVGGTILAPILGFEKLVLTTSEGVELIWTDLELPVYEIDPSIAGVFGCELMTSGWLAGVFGTGEYGYIEQISFDFRDSDNLNGTMVLDLNGDYDNVVWPLPGDADGSGYVDDDDLSLMLTNWNSPAGWTGGDFSGDGYVDDDDLSLLLSNWHGGVPPTAGAPVPEPATMMLLAAGAAGLGRRRRRG